MCLHKAKQAFIISNKKQTNPTPVEKRKGFEIGIPKHEYVEMAFIMASARVAAAPEISVHTMCVCHMDIYIYTWTCQRPSSRSPRD